MDDRTTTTDFIRTQPLDRPVTRKRVKSKTGRRLGLLLLVAAAAAAGWWIYTRQPTPPPARQNAFTATMPVVAAGAVTGDIDITLNGLGTVTSLATVTIKSQISGQLVRVAYQEGQMINKGDLLAEIDDRSYQLALQNAEGALARDQAILQSAELDLKRYQDLAKTNAIPRQQLDTQVSLVAQDKGLVISDKAQIDTQKLNIAYCHIVSPVTGRAGLRLVDPGNYVTANDASGIVVITQLKPISVIFTVAEDNLPQIVKRLRAGATLPVTAFDRSGTTKPTTGTLKLRAEFANEDDSLFPNQFVNIRLLIDTLHDATVVPTSAIQRGAPGTFVYLVNADNTVAVRPVTLGPASAERVAIQTGLAPGDRVVVDGADKLRSGARVVVRGADGGAGGGGAPGGNRPAQGDGGRGAATGTADPAGNTATGNQAPGGAANGGRRSRG